MFFHKILGEFEAFDGDILIFFIHVFYVDLQGC